MNDVEIRPTIPADLDTLADVLVQVHAVDGYPVEGVDEPRAWVELPDSLGQWTALLCGRPVGHVALLRPCPGDGAPTLLDGDATATLGDVGVLARLFIAPAARRRSLADALMRVVEEAADQAHLTVVLDVMEKDAAAIKLYESRGWKLLGGIKHEAGQGAPVEALAFARYRPALP